MMETIIKATTKRTSEKEMEFIIGLGEDTKVSLIEQKMEEVPHIKVMDNGKRDSTRTIHEKENSC